MRSVLPGTCWTALAPHQLYPNWGRTRLGNKGTSVALKIVAPTSFNACHREIVLLAHPLVSLPKERSREGASVPWFFDTKIFLAAFTYHHSGTKKRRRQGMSRILSAVASSCITLLFL